MAVVKVSEEIRQGLRLLTSREYSNHNMGSMLGMLVERALVETGNYVKTKDGYATIGYTLSYKDKEYIIKDIKDDKVIFEDGTSMSVIGTIWAFSIEKGITDEE